MAAKRNPHASAFSARLSIRITSNFPYGVGILYDFERPKSWDRQWMKFIPSSIHLVQWCDGMDMIADPSVIPIEFHKISNLEVDQHKKWFPLFNSLKIFLRNVQNHTEFRLGFRHHPDLFPSLPKFWSIRISSTAGLWRRTKCMLFDEHIISRIDYNLIRKSTAFSKFFVIFNLTVYAFQMFVLFLSWVEWVFRKFQRKEKIKIHRNRKTTNLSKNVDTA